MTGNRPILMKNNVLLAQNSCSEFARERLASRLRAFAAVQERYSPLCCGSQRRRRSVILLKIGLVSYVLEGPRCAYANPRFTFLPRRPLLQTAHAMAERSFDPSNVRLLNISALSMLAPFFDGLHNFPNCLSCSRGL